MARWMADCVARCVHGWLQVELSVEQPVADSLRAWIDTRGPVPSAVAAGAAVQLARGLHFLHTRRIVHLELRLQVSRRRDDAVS